MIELTRGDIAIFSITITNDNGEIYKAQEGDKIVFTLKNNTLSQNVIIQKEVIDGIVKIEHEDTKDLEYGKYVFDVQLTFANGDICTVIKPSPFILTEEVNFDD